MAYTFQSRATSDLIMLDSVGKTLLQLLDKTPGEPGVLTVAQIPAALQTLEAAVRADDAKRRAIQEDSQQPDADANARAAKESAELGAVTLHQRVAPFADMLRRSAAEGKDVTWHL